MASVASGWQRQDSARQTAAKPLALGLILLIALAAGFWLSPAFTGAILYSQWGGEGTIVAAEATGFAVGNIVGGQDYDPATFNYNTNHEIINESTSGGGLHWNYEFNSTYNVTNPTLLELKIFGIYWKVSGENLTIRAYNYDTEEWDDLNETNVPALSANKINISVFFNWSQRSLSSYMHKTNGRMNVSIQDDGSADQTPDWLYINYIAINATFSPLIDELFSLGNASGSDDYAQSNYTALNYSRYDALAVGAEWNASNVSYGTVVVNASGNVSEWHLGNITQNWTYAMLDLGNATMFPTGGNVTVRFTANDSWYQHNTSHIAADFGVYGFGSVAAISANASANRTATGYPVSVYCRVADNESGVGVPGYNVSFFNNSALFGHALTNASGWAHAVWLQPSPAQVNGVSCNVSDSLGIWYFAGLDDNESMALNVTADSDLPSLDALLMDSAGANDSYRTNLYMNASVLVNASDATTDVQSVSVNITYPSKFYVSGSLHAFGGGWRFVFAANDTGIALNETGNYTVNVTVSDLAGNLNMSWNLTFNVTANYSVALAGYYDDIFYTRGENLTFEVLDTNGIGVAGANVNLSLEGYDGSAMTEWYNATNATYMLWLNASYNVSNYTVMAMAEKNGSLGLVVFRFNVTGALKVLRESYTPGPNELVGGSLKLYVNNTRGGRFNYTVTVNATCADGSSYMLSKTGEYYSNSSLGCRAPNAYSTSFSITINATDHMNNNTNVTAIALTTSSAPSSSPEGGSSSSGGGTPAVRCNCTEWKDIGCGIFGAGALEMYQERVCVPVGCSEENRTIFYPQCAEMKIGFNFTLERGNVGILRGENQTVIGTISNTGNVSLHIGMTASAGCCAVHVPGNLTVSNLSSVDVPIAIHASLEEALGDCIIVLNATTTGLEASKSISVRVDENPLIPEIASLRDEIERLRQEIGSYRESGVDTSAAEALAARMEQRLADAASAVSSDDLAGLRAAVEGAQAELRLARAELAASWTWKFLSDNKWNIAAAAILLLIASYITTEIAVPYVRMDRRIKRLVGSEKSQVEGRKATEIQYFQGKIDEKAFEDILVGKQSEILKTKGEIRHLMQEKDEILKKKMSAGAVKEWLRSGFGLRRLAARLRRKKAPASKHTSR